MIKEQVIKIYTLSEILEDTNVLFLNDCRNFYEDLEEYEACAKIRDRIIEIQNTEQDVNII